MTTEEAEFFPSDIWCNPFSLEQYPLGFITPSRMFPETVSQNGFYGPARDFRELADPEVWFENGKWYLFASCGDVYVSEDLAHWKYHKLTFADGEKVGYAPTVTRCAGRYLLSSSFPFAGGKTEILCSENIFGPYRSLGCPRDGDGQELFCWLDPMLFTDHDGRLYAYWGFGGEGPGVYGIELEAANPVQGIGKAVKLLDFVPERIFEHSGEYNELQKHAYVEGASMFRHDNGEYYLQYCAGGTQYKTYCVGVYRSAAPLGPFRVQEKPAALQNSGRVCGTGHGCWCRGPGGKVYQFYTCSIRRVHMNERRVGMDEVTFDQDGNASVQITSTPRSVTEGDTGWLPLSVNKPCMASSSMAFHHPGLAADDCTHTFWMPDMSEPEPFWEVDLLEEFMVYAFQLQWAEEGLDCRNGICPEAVEYKVEFFTCREDAPAAVWKHSGMDPEMLIDFQLLEKPCHARYVKISFRQPVTEQFRRGINLFTVFGKG